MLILLIILIIIVFMSCGLKKVSWNERYIVFTSWKYTTVLEPWLRHVWPFFQTVYKLDFNNTINETTAELEKHDIPLEIKKKILNEHQKFKKYYADESVKKD